MKYKTNVWQTKQTCACRISFFQADGATLAHQGFDWVANESQTPASALCFDVTVTSPNSVISNAWWQYWQLLSLPLTMLFIHPVLSGATVSKHNNWQLCAMTIAKWPSELLKVIGSCHISGSFCPYAFSWSIKPCTPIQHCVQWDSRGDGAHTGTLNININHHYYGMGLGHCRSRNFLQDSSTV